MQKVGADIPEDGIAIAAMGLGLSLADISRSGVVRAALALFHGKPREEARGYVQAKPAPRLGSDSQDFVSAMVPDELADVGSESRAYAIRVGLGMAAGLSRKQAENWARVNMRPVGRPKGSKNSAPSQPVTG